MTKPQLENGYTRIANEILEAVIYAGLNGTEMAVLLYIIRKTYGFNKKEDEISLTQFEKAVPYSRRAIIKAIKHLRLVNIITLVNKGISVHSSNRYKFNKTGWTLMNKESPVRLVNKLTQTSEQTDKTLVNKGIHTKDTITKDNIQKTIVSKDTTDKSEKPQYGNEDINKMLEALKGKIGIDDFADSQRWSRIYAKHCVTLIGKIGKDEFVRRLDIILDDSFKLKNSNKIKYVYEQIKGFVEPKSIPKF
jgi:phage replication O-like protein O